MLAYWVSLLYNFRAGFYFCLAMPYSRGWLGKSELIGRHETDKGGNMITKEMKEAIDFCGCNDKACVLVYMGSSFSKDDYDEQCK